MTMASRASIIIGFLSTISACAGARVSVSADRAAYPISFSTAVRDKTGMLHAAPTLQKVGDFYATKTAVGFLYSSVSLPGSWDVSEEINRQVRAAGGEAVVNFRLAATNGCAVLNSFPLLNALPIWPGCAPLQATGDIVVRAGVP